MRSSEATVCRLFLTRWWISRIVASLVMSSCSWWRSSVTSRHSTIAPMRLPWSRSGIVRSDTVTPRASMSARHGARPLTTSGSDSSNWRLAGRMRVVTSTEGLPLQLVVESHAIEGGQRVGARERGDPVHIEADQPVRCAGRPAAGRGGCGQVGEVARGDHPEQVVGAVVERDLLTRRGARLAQIGVPREHADRQCRLAGACAQDRHGADARGGLFEPVRRCGIDDAQRSGTPPAPACATGAARGRRRCRGRTASPRRPDACARRRRTSRPRWAPRSRCRRTRDRPAADRHRRGGGATRRRLHSIDPGRRRDR